MFTLLELNCKNGVYESAIIVQNNIKSLVSVKDVIANIANCDNAILAHRNNTVYFRTKHGKQKIKTNASVMKVCTIPSSNLPETERVFLSIVKTNIDNFWIKHTENPWYKENITAIIGIRRIGKTILLKQLNNCYTNSVYIDCSTITNRILTDVLDMHIANNIRIFFLDEVCKLSEKNSAELVAYIKTVKNVYFVITGSVPVVVESLINNIGDGFSIYMPPIMYCEYLTWGYATSTQSVFSITDHMKLLNYIGETDLVSKQVQLIYINSLIEDTLFSYRRDRYAAYRKQLRSWLNSIDKSKLELLLRYISECVFIYKPKGEVSIFNDPNSVTLPTDATYSKLFTANDIEMFCKILENAGLLKSVYMQNGVTSNTAYLFEHPQFVRRYASLSYSAIDEWLEELLLLRAKYYYNNTGKYRTSIGDHEVDIFNLINTNCNLIEVKNRPLNNIVNQFDKYANISSIANIPVIEHVITNSEIVYAARKVLSSTQILDVQVIRNDILVLLLELGYVDAIRTQSLDRLTVHDLYTKYLGNN